MNKVLLAGATGYLGGFTLKELLTKEFEAKIVVRIKRKVPTSILESNKIEIEKAELTFQNLLKIVAGI